MSEIVSSMTLADWLLGFTAMILLVITAILYMIYSIRTDRLRNDYFESLNEHDKSVIASYFEKKYRFLKKKSK